MSDSYSAAVDNPAYTVEQAIANIQQREDLGARYYAAWWLGRFRVRQPEAISA
ncbi:MAG: HEAT repeat domain-containing protein, partial [Microcystis sp. M49636_WE2]|nr:HEAT repeat domain-containing protein [Microcystis sp. M49636_WE2]